ncbi:unnamed protein product [Eruca vesicaria subsp. sativa]|uniref:Uncharacterized protein n=1 Tax=Eruca vesicaria subsp. sativa TaxID=29727 RepID=A0ABC8LKW8_ERUVS|nr:unnamed protein product [Eruca vesicaria subsp. sativa]
MKIVFSLMKILEVYWGLGQLSNDVNLLPIEYADWRVFAPHRKDKAWDMILTKFWFDNPDTKKNYVLSVLGSSANSVKNGRKCVNGISITIKRILYHMYAKERVLRGSDATLNTKQEEHHAEQNFSLQAATQNIDHVN